MKLFLSLILILSCLIGPFSVFASTPEQDLSESIKMLQSKKAYSHNLTVTYSFKGNVEVTKPCIIKFQNFSILKEIRVNDQNSIEPNLAETEVYETFLRHVNEVSSEYMVNVLDPTRVLYRIRFKRETPFTIDGLPSTAVYMIFDLPYKTQNDKDTTIKGLTLFTKALTELQRRCQE